MLVKTTGTASWRPSMGLAGRFAAAAFRDELAGIGLAIRAGLHIGEIELHDGGVGGIAVQLFAAGRRRGLGRITP